MTFTRLFSIFLLCLPAAGGCTLPGSNSLDESERAFDSRDGYVRAIRAFLQGKEREKVEFTAEELRAASDGFSRYKGPLGVKNTGNSGPTGAVLSGGYNEDFEEEKFTLRQLHKIYRFVIAVKEDKRFRKELSSVIYLLRSQRNVTVHGLRKDNTYGTFTIDYGRTEPGGAIVEEDGRLRVLFCEPRYSNGPSTYVRTDHSMRVADIGTFHGHPSYPGPTSQDIVSFMTYRTDSFIIADRGNKTGAYRANLNYVTSSGKGLDLNTIRLPKPDYASFEHTPIVP